MLASIGNLFAARGMMDSAAYQQAMAASAQQRQQQLFYQQQLEMRPFSTQPKRTTEAGAQCGGCGSRETMIHRGARMCAYCRSDR